MLLVGDDINEPCSMVMICLDFLLTQPEFPSLSSDASTVQGMSKLPFLPSSEWSYDCFQMTRCVKLKWVMLELCKLDNVVPKPSI